MLYYIWFEVPNGSTNEHVGIILEAQNTDDAVKRVVEVVLDEWECGTMTIHHIEPVLDKGVVKWFEENQANGRLWL